MSAQILIVDDDVAIRQVLRTSLMARGYEVRAVSTGIEGIDRVRDSAPDLVLLDLGLPDMDGREVCVAMRAISGAPILVLSARFAEDEKVALLDAGAHDYMVKPYGTAELLARIRAALRVAAPGAGAPAPAPALTTLGSLRLALDQRQAWVGMTPVAFTPTEWRLLAALSRAPRRTITYEALSAAVWGRASADRAGALQMYLSQIKAKVTTAGGTLPITNVPQFGYRLEA